MAKKTYNVSDVNTANGATKFIFRLRDMKTSKITEITVKANDVFEAKKKINDGSVLQHKNYIIVRVTDNLGSQYVGRQLVTFHDESTAEELVEKTENAELVTDSQTVQDADKYFKVTYKAGENVYSAVMVGADTEELAKKKFIERKPNYADKIVSVTETWQGEVTSMRRRGMSVFDRKFAIKSKLRNDWYYSEYGDFVSMSSSVKKFNTRQEAINKIDSMQSNWEDTYEIVEIADGCDVKDYGEFENIEFDSSNDNLATNEVLFKYSELNGVQKRNTNGITELNFGGDWYKPVHTRVVPIGGGATYFIRMQKIKDACSMRDWNGSYNGATYDYSNGQWTITHKNGKVEKFPDNKFNKIEEVYTYIDNFKDSKIIDKQLTYELIENEQEAKAFAQKHNGTVTPYKTNDGSFNGFIVWFKDACAIEDANTCFVIATKDQDEWYTGDVNRKFAYALKSVKKFNTRQQAEQEAQNVLGANWRDKYGVFEINSNLEAYTSLQWKPQDSSCVKDGMYADELEYWAKKFGGKLTNRDRLFYTFNFTSDNGVKQFLEKLSELDYATRNNTDNPSFGVVKVSTRVIMKDSATVYAPIVDNGCNLQDSLQVTSEPGTDKIIYVMQSDLDNNLYFYIGKTYSMKDGMWSYAKFKINGTSPEQLKKDLENNGWHEVASGPARIIDEQNNLDVCDATFDSSDIEHTADYLWTWTNKGRQEVADKIFDEHLYKYNTKEEAIQHIDEAYKNALKDFETYYSQLKTVVNKRLEEGYKMNRNALEQRKSRFGK